MENTEKKADRDHEREEQDEETFRVKDRRHWKDEEESAQKDDGEEPRSTPAQPTIIDEFRARAETAETKLQEYIEAFKQHRDDQEQFRVRLDRDVERRVSLKFSELVGRLLESLDNLDLALDHARDVPEAAPLAHGVSLAREGFLAALDQAGVERLAPDGETFDPNTAEALRMDPVAERERDGTVTETLQAGYRLGEQVIRPARVAVGRYDPSATSDG